MKKVYLEDIDLEDYGFDENGYIETIYHTVQYLYYDIGRLSIKSKENWGNDDIYIERNIYKKIIFLCV